MDGMKTPGVLFTLLGIVWLLPMIGVNLGTVSGWLNVAIALLGGLYIMFMEK
jgi:uncharacterized membrane protein